MKIEKLNENKIRITLNLVDLVEKNIDFHSFMSNSIETQEVFINMLEEAEKSIGFTTKDHKIMIEALATPDNNFVLTVTKMAPEIEKQKYKKISIKRKNIVLNDSFLTYSFFSFDDFCEFCKYLKNINFSSGFLKALNNSLYTYNEKYYLMFIESDINLVYLKDVYIAITEFGQLVHNSKLFECKLKEYGEIIIKSKALQTGMKFFA